MPTRAIESSFFYNALEGKRADHYVIAYNALEVRARADHYVIALSCFISQNTSSLLVLVYFDFSQQVIDALNY